MSMRNISEGENVRGGGMSCILAYALRFVLGIVRQFWLHIQVCLCLCCTNNTTTSIDFVPLGTKMRTINVVCIFNQSTHIDGNVR